MTKITTISHWRGVDAIAVPLGRRWNLPTFRLEIFPGSEVFGYEDLYGQMHEYGVNVLVKKEHFRLDDRVSVLKLFSHKTLGLESGKFPSANQSCVTAAINMIILAAIELNGEDQFVFCGMRPRELSGEEYAHALIAATVFGEARKILI